MNRPLFPIVIGLSLVALMAFVVHSILNQPRRAEEPVPPPSSPAIVSQTALPYSANYRYTVSTFKHDGHLWVWIEPADRSATTPVHHPDCPCLKPKS